MTPDGLLASVLEHSPQSVSVYELDSTVVFMNAATERMMGASFDALRGKRLFELYPDAIGTAFHKAFFEAAAGGNPQDFVHYYPLFAGWFANHVCRVGDRVHVYAREVSDDVRRQRRLDTVARISEVITRTELDLHATAQAVAEIVSEVLECDCTIAQMSSDGTMLERIAQACTDPEALALLAPIDRWPATMGNTGEALRSHRSLLSVSNLVSESDDAALHGVLTRYEPTSVVAAPLLLDDVPIGALSVGRRRGAPPLTEHERELIDEIAPSIALYVSNAARRAEAASLRSRLTTMADALPVLASFIDKNECYQYVNAGYERWFGEPRENYLGRPLREMLGEEAYATLEPHVRAVLAGQPQRFRSRVAYAKGARDVDVQYVPIRDVNNVVEGFAVLVSDITTDVRIAEVERQHREVERRAAERLRALLALTARLAGARHVDDIARVLVDGGREVMESLAATMWRETPDGMAELVRGSGELAWSVNVGDRVPLDAIRPIAECLRAGTPIWMMSAAEAEARYPEVALRARARPPARFAVLPLGVNSCLGFSFKAEQPVSADDRTYLELLASHGAEALRRAHALDELVQTASNAQRARAEAEAANRSKDEFLAMLGHELRNPLAPLVTALELMRMKSDGMFERERAVIGRQVQHLSRLVDDLLDVSRITRGKVDLRRERVTIADVIAKAVEQTSPLFEERRHHLALDLAPDLAVSGDPTRLAQVFGNLLSNAAKYTPRAGHVEVSAKQSGAVIQVRVRDDGIGIPASIVPHVFDLFVQAPQSSERPAGGLGLGLTIVRSLVEAHGGTVTVESEGPGRGTQFTVTLPAIVTATAGADAASGPRINKTQAARRVLVVDDNEDAAMMLADMLDAYGHDIRTAFDGPSALRIADEFRPEVAVLDIGLPVMDGYELAQRLRAFHDVRLIAVTGYGQESDRRRSLEAGFQAHLAKPVEIDELVQLVERG